MSRTLMPYLSEILRRVETKIDQSEGYVGEGHWSRQARVDACKDEYLFLWQEVSNLDVNFGTVRDTTLTLTGNQQTFTLPTNCRSIHKVVEIDSQNRPVVGGEIPVGNYNDMAGWDGVGGIHDPDNNQLFFPHPPGSTLSVMVVYGTWPLQLAHGNAQGGSNTTIDLEDYESVEDDDLIGQSLYVYEGTGAGDTLVITDYDGPTRRATVTGVTTLIDNTSRYTSRPLLPRDCLDPMVYGVCGRLLEDIEDERYPAMYRKRMEHFQRMEESLLRRDRRVARHIRNDAGYYHQDPYSRRFGG